MTVHSRFVWETDDLVVVDGGEKLDKLFNEADHPRDEHGRWTDGGGGDDATVPAVPKVSDNKEVKAALGKDIAHPNLYSIREKVERGAWNLTVEKVKTDYRGTTTKIAINVPVPSNWVKHTKPYPSSGVEYYDPDKVVLDEDGRTAIKIDTEAAIPKTATPGVIYRGMSWEEYQGALENGHFKSRGDYNLGEAQVGLTYYSSDPGQAVSYAHSYAPSAYKATPGRPAVVVGVADPGDHYVVPQQPTELGIRTPVPTSAIREVYFGDPILAQPGDTEVIQESGRPPMEGSGMSPSVWVNWRKEGDDNVRELKEASRRHPGEGYTAEAYIANGIIHTDDVYDAARALQEGHAVELDQPRTASLLITELGKISKNMIAHGEKAPTFNLCKVTIKGTSLFCADAQGIPRVKMPQLTMEQDQPFFDHLKSKGYTVERHDEYASYLRATQNELNGAKVAGIAAAMRSTEGYHSSSNPIFVSSDNYILDGHHRWAAEIGVDATDNVLANDKTMPVWRVNIPITRLLAEAEAFTGGEGKLSVEDEAARKKSLQAKADAHTDWMNECVPEMMSYGKDQVVAVAACLNMWRQAWEESHPDGADDPGTSRPGSDKYDPEEKQLQTILARARTFARLFNEAEHPRDEHGRWTDGGGSDDAVREGTKADMEAKYGKPSANWQATASGLNTKEERRLEADNNFIRRNQDPGAYSAAVKVENDVPYYSEYVKIDADHSYWRNFITTPKGIAEANLMMVFGADKPTLEIQTLLSKDRGSGRAALEMLTKAADEHGVYLQLDPVPLDPPEGGEGVKMSKEKLESFYAQFGFVQEGERDEDGKGTITMVREPRSPEEAAPAVTGSYTASDASISEFEAAGVDIEDMTRTMHRQPWQSPTAPITDTAKDQREKFWAQWNRHIKMPPAQFKKEFLGGMDGTMDVSSMVLTKNGEIETDWLGLKGTLSDKDGEIGTYSRTLKFLSSEGESNMAETNRLFLNKERQGGGIAKKMLAANIAFFKKAGIEKVRTTTDEVGGYAWAKYGFYPNNGLEFRQGTDIYDRIEKIKDEDDRKWMTAVAEGGLHEDMRSIWIMADSKYGKELLMNMSWDGVLDLNDEKSMKRFDAYVAKGK